MKRIVKDTKVGARSGCPINMKFEIRGDTWSLLVIRDMIFGDRLGRPVGK